MSSRPPKVSSIFLGAIFGSILVSPNEILIFGLLLGFSEASLGLLRSVSWAAQSDVESMENVMLEFPDSSGKAAVLPGLCQEVPRPENHANAGMISVQIGMILAKSS